MTRTTRIAQLSKSRRRPIIAVIVGVILFAAGLILGRIPYPVEGFHQGSGVFRECPLLS